MLEFLWVTKRIAWGLVAVEFGSDAVKALKSHFGVSGIPMLVVPNKDIELVTKE